MKNTVYYLEKEGHFSPKTTEMTKLSSNFIRVKNLYCGICGGDYSKFIGRRAKYNISSNISLGHEFVSKIVEVGSDVLGFEEGMLVVSDFNYRCNNCIYCKSKKSHLCNDNAIGLFSNRAFATYSDIHHSYLTVFNPNSDNIVSGTCVEPLSCLIHAVNSVRFSKEERILITGCGNIGTMASFYLRLVLGMPNVLVWDTIPEKIARLVEFFGCKKYSGEEDFDVVFEATNSVQGLLWALSKAKKGGKVCSISHLYGFETSPAYNEIVKNEINITFPLRNGEKSNIQKAERLISTRWEQSFNALLEVSPLSGINKTFENKPTSLANKQIIQIV